MYRSKGKRITDILLAAMGLITSLPFFVVLPLVLGVYFKGNPFFVQRRPGLHGRTFKIFKFRTMRAGDSPVSRLGAILRRTSLDELPQFWNVLRGDMSVVGPRPLLVEYLSLYDAHQFRRHDVKPGITGLAQINGRNALAWDEKFAFDVHYVDNLSFFLDMQIICGTAVKLLLIRKTDCCGIETTPFNGQTIC